jgi:hypothetical protein
MPIVDSAFLGCRGDAKAEATAGPSTLFGARNAPNSAQDDNAVGLNTVVTAPANTHSQTIRIRQP